MQVLFTLRSATSYRSRPGHRRIRGPLTLTSHHWGMSKRYKKVARGALWLTALAICGFAAVLLVDANRTGQQLVSARAGSDPDTTGSVDQKSMRWCGAASWCR